MDRRERTPNILALIFLVYVIAAVALAIWTAYSFLFRPYDHRIQLSASELHMMDYDHFRADVFDNSLSRSNDLLAHRHYRRAALALWEASAFESASAISTRRRYIGPLPTENLASLISLEFSMSKNGDESGKFGSLVKWLPRARSQLRYSEIWPASHNPRRSFHSRFRLNAGSHISAGKYLTYCDMSIAIIGHLLRRGARLASTGRHAQAGMIYWQAAADKAVVPKGADGMASAEYWD